MSMQPLVSAQGVSKRFAKAAPWAVDDVGLQIRRGSTYALVGESGSGKSTLARLLVGLHAPTRGQVRFDGIDVHRPASVEEKRALHRRVQMVFQDPYASLNPRWRVRDIVGEPLREQRLVQGEAALRERVAALLADVGLKPDDMARYPHQFSGGQRQRISIARALASAPDFLVCDEPTSALDVSVQAQVLNLMRDLQRERGLTYLFISHNLAVVRYMADEVGVMLRGRLVEQASKAQLFEQPSHAYTQALMRAVPPLRVPAGASLR
jgi:peptide/nickel transport system ATP-binding protein